MFATLSALAILWGWLGGGGTLDLAVLPTFGTRWLAPRLPDFLSANPGVTVNLTTRFTRFDFAAERFDAMIYYGSDDWPGAAHLKLFDERLTACASSALLTAHPVAGPADLHGMVLLQLATRSDAWAAWFRGQGAAPPARIDGMVMDQFSMMVQAAISGLLAGAEGASLKASRHAREKSWSEA